LIDTTATAITASANASAVIISATATAAAAIAITAPVNTPAVAVRAVTTAPANTSAVAVPAAAPSPAPSSAPAALFAYGLPSQKSLPDQREEWNQSWCWRIVKYVDDWGSEILIDFLAEAMLKLQPQLRLPACQGLKEGQDAELFKADIESATTAASLMS
jgi:hypothetical protein